MPLDASLLLSPSSCFAEASGTDTTLRAGLVATAALHAGAHPVSSLKDRVSLNSRRARLESTEWQMSCIECFLGTLSVVEIWTAKMYRFLSYVIRTDNTNRESPGPQASGLTRVPYVETRMCRHDIEENISARN
jgi:hypothetical protein